MSIVGKRVAAQLEEAIAKYDDKRTRKALRKCLREVTIMVETVCVTAVTENQVIGYGPTFDKGKINLLFATPHDGLAMTMEQWSPIVEVPPIWSTGNYWEQIAKAVREGNGALASVLLAHRLGEKGLAQVNETRHRILATSDFTPVVIALACAGKHSATGAIAVASLPPLLEAQLTKFLQEEAKP